jgi:hypothetical protein
MQLPTTPFDTDRAIRLPGRVNGTAVVQENRRINMIDETFIQSLKAKVVHCKCASSEFMEGAFDRALEKYHDWLQGLPASTSTINHRLHFLHLAADELDETSIRKDDGIIDVVLIGSGVREVGEQFERVGPNGIKERWTVIWRQISPMWGVEMGLRNDEGKILAWEFFD